VEEGVILQRKGPSLTALLRWSGLALVAGSVLMVVATVLHPSRETPAAILEAEVRLVAAHALLTCRICWSCSASPHCMEPRRSGWAGSAWSGSCLCSWARC
jgi:hypothetical protein